MKRNKIMKNPLRNLRKKLVFVGAIVATSLALGAATIANFGPDRPTKVWTAQENGFNYVTYNSYTGVPNGIGDERDFLRGVVTGRDANWQDPVANVANNDKVTAKVYIHNNADPLLNSAPGNPGIARNVNVKIDIPKGLLADHEVKTTISADNAIPKAVYDTLDISGVNDSLFQLKYVPGSAKLAGQTLPDSIFTTGLKLEDQKGCFEFIREITFEMQVQKPGYQIQKTARLKGEDSTKWRKEVNAKRGDLIEWRISFQNIGSTQLDDVKVVDDLPSYTDVVPGSVELVNSNYPNGFKYDASAIQNNGDMVNVDIQDYLPGSNAFLYLETKIEDHKDIQCGIHQIANVVYVTPNGLGTLNDNAKVNVINSNQCVETVTSCDSLTVDKLTIKKGETANFTANATAQGSATINGYIFKVNGNTLQDSASKTFAYKGTSAGAHTVSVTVRFSNGEKTSANCQKTITVEEDVMSIVCESLTAPKYLLKVNEKVVFTAKATTQNTTVKNYIFSVDGKQVQKSASDKFEFMQSKAGSYFVSVAVESADGQVVTSDNCVKSVDVEVEPMVVCKSLTAPTYSLKKGQSTVFTAEATKTGNVTITSYVFTVNGVEAQKSASNKFTFNATTLGKFDVAVEVVSSIGNTTSSNCVKSVDVVEEIKPIYRCESFSLSKNSVKIGERFTATVRVTAKDGATFKMATFTFGDEATDQNKTVTNIIKDGVVTVDHSYNKVGTYGPRVKLTFEVNGKMVDVEDPKCAAEIKVTPNEIVKCTVPGKTHLPANDPDCKVLGVTTLPKTGMEGIAGLFAGVTAAGAALHRKLTLRRK
jgi:uncharacterized repeat protein (TIGR01451 family)